MHRAFWTMLNAPSTLIAGIVVFLIIPLLLGSLFTDLGTLNTLRVQW